MITFPTPNDRNQIHDIAARISTFSPEEVECVDELWQEYQIHGPERSGYYWLVARDEDGRVLGFTCYGPRPLTEGTFDLYWLAVDTSLHHNGIGRSLLAATEEDILKLGGRLVFVETSNLPSYESTRNFYLHTGYTWAATVKDFYRDGDDLVIFTKHL